MIGGHAQNNRFCSGSEAMRPYAGNQRRRQEAVTQSLADNPVRKPVDQAILVKLPRSGKHDKIINRLVIRYFNQYPGRSLVR